MVVATTDFLNISTAARELGVSPNLLSVSFHRGALPERFAPLVAGRRLIERSDLPEIRRLLMRRGHRCNELPTT